MHAKGYLFGVTAALTIAVLVLLSGCAQPPTEKVTALQNALSECESKGAEVFAPTEHQNVTQKMAELNTLMEGKKYGKATQLADSINTDMEALKAAIDNNGKQAATQVLASANEQLTALKGLLTEENLKVLGEEAATKYQQIATDQESKVAAMQSAMDSGNVMDVYNSSSVATELSAAVQSFNAELEQAKAAAAAKKPAGKKKK